MVNEVSAYLRETRLVSPITGEVLDVLPEQGELVDAGYPIIMLVDLTDSGSHSISVRIKCHD
jgi:HlyD family secretion protein